MIDLVQFPVIGLASEKPGASRAIVTPIRWAIHHTQSQLISPKNYAFFRDDQEGRGILSQEKEKLPQAWQLFEDTIPKVMSPPTKATLEEFKADEVKE